MERGVPTSGIKAIPRKRAADRPTVRPSLDESAVTSCPSDCNRGGLAQRWGNLRHLTRARGTQIISDGRTCLRIWQLGFPVVPSVKGSRLAIFGPRQRARRSRRSIERASLADPFAVVDYSFNDLPAVVHPQERAVRTSPGTPHPLICGSAIKPASASRCRNRNDGTAYASSSRPARTARSASSSCASDNLPASTWPTLSKWSNSKPHAQRFETK
jgi:hypothetical protein